MKKTHPAKYRILAVLLAVLMVLALLPSSVLATGETTTRYIAFTSDVHGATDSLNTWLGRLGVSPDCMIFGGDYPVRGTGEDTAHEAAQQCVSSSMGCTAGYRLPGQRQPRHGRYIFQWKLP
jgi:hypothetical protein